MKWLTAVLLAVAAVLGGLLLYRSVSPAPAGGTALDTPVDLPALRLVNERGEATPLNASGGRIRLVFYGFVRCPDVCPATLASLARVYADLPEAQRERVQVQFITVDPGHDRPEVVRDYLGRFNPAFSGLTGEAATIDEAARVMFVANVKPLPQPVGDHNAHLGHGSGGALDAGNGAANAEAAGATAAEAARIHGDQVSVVDPQGRFVRVYANGEVLDGTLAADLPGLIRTYGGS
ncbi:protein SCO1/2 [Deinococcus sp. HSC-46F16]|uniref:SCO family protein n=1 Tax=Deinococcus sp. HSC-46F16 TaxID=2910968 RepID=UPI0020A2150E|nr:SCO family protein [Deinococcus sp. HSC-46F16]MCP2015045.1 protein SCO1/2 [Deinococcus sp. HSC-46F16]